MAARAAWYATEYMETTPPFEVEYQQRDLGILRAHGELLTFDQVAVSEEEQAEAATVLRMLREPLAQDTANR